MDGNTIFKKLNQQKYIFNGIAEDLNNHLRKELKIIVHELPSFGGRSWVIKGKNKRVYLDFYGTGQIVFCFQSIKTDTEPFPEPNLDPVPTNSADLTIERVLEKLIEKIKEHLNVS